MKLCNYKIIQDITLIPAADTDVKAITFWLASEINEFTKATAVAIFVGSGSTIVKIYAHTHNNIM